MTPDEFPAYTEPVGVLVSGGADSALMLYCVLKKCTGPIHVFTITNNKKGMFNTRASLDVIRRCIELTGNTRVEQHIFYREAQQRSDFYDIADLYRSRGLLERVFMGITANPPSAVLDTFTCELPNNIIEMRDPDIIREEYPDSGFILPWINTNKKQLAEYYQSLDLIESLYTITRSCEDEHNKFTRPCGRCYWCEERLWGFGRLT